MTLNGLKHILATFFFVYVWRTLDFTHFVTLFFFFFNTFLKYLLVCTLYVLFFGGSHNSCNIMHKAQDLLYKSSFSQEDLLHAVPVLDLSPSDPDPGDGRKECSQRSHVTVIILEITYRILPGGKIYMKSTMNANMNICRRRDPKCYFDLIPKRNIKNQWQFCFEL